MGTPAAAVPTLERLIAAGHEVAAVYTQPDRPSGRGKRVTFSPVKQFAVDHGLTTLQPVKIKTPEALEEFSSFNADAAIVVAYGRILPESFLTAFPSGAINVHFSLLPKYRGAAPVNWAVVNGETRTGVTTMKMDAGLDTGDILLQAETDIGPQETASELTERLARIGAGLLVETLGNFSAIEPRPQSDEEATFAPILKKEDGAANWAMTATEIANRVRGFQPFPGVFTFYRGSRLTIWKAEAVSESLECGSPGRIAAAKADNFIVDCGSNTQLRLFEVQPEGKKRMAVRDFINGARPTVGDLLGD